MLWRPPHPYRHYPAPLCHAYCIPILKNLAFPFLSLSDIGGPGLITHSLKCSPASLLGCCLPTPTAEAVASSPLLHFPEPRVTAPCAVVFLSNSNRVVLKLPPTSISHFFYLCTNRNPQMGTPVSPNGFMFSMLDPWLVVFWCYFGRLWLLYEVGSGW